MEIVVLGLLMIQDLTIYQLNQAFKSGISLIYSASYGSLLSALKKLLVINEITFKEVVDRGRNKKIYHITEKGKAHFYQWMLADIDENKLETMVLCKVFFLGLIDSKTEKKKILKNILAAISTLGEKFNQLSKSLNSLQFDDEEMKIHRYQFMTLDYGIRTYEVAREWVEEILNEINA